MFFINFIVLFVEKNHTHMDYVYTEARGCEKTQRDAWRETGTLAEPETGGLINNII